jgi:hypothetical protein
MPNNLKPYEKAILRRFISTDAPICLQERDVGPKYQLGCMCVCMCDYPHICPGDCSCPCSNVARASLATPTSKAEDICFDRQSFALARTFRVRGEHFGGLLFDSSSQTIYVLNETAFQMVLLLKSPRSSQRMFLALAEKYTAQDNILKDDIGGFLRLLKIIGGLEIS